MAMVYGFFYVHVIILIERSENLIVERNITMNYLTVNLKKYRIQKNYTQEDVAEYLGITSTAGTYSEDLALNVHTKLHIL